MLGVMEQSGDASAHSSPDFRASRDRWAELYLRGEAALERVAGLAEAHAEREASLGRTESAANERRNAAKARDAAARCRANAQHLR